MPEKSILPFLVLAGGFAWFGLFAWLQRRLMPQSGSGFGAQRFVLIGLAGLAICMVAGAIAAMRLWAK